MVCAMWDTMRPSFCALLGLIVGSVMLGGCGASARSHDGVGACDDTERSAAAELGQTCEAITFDLDTWCSPALRKFGRCKMPSASCSSDLGRAIASQAWGASHAAGTVPSELLYTTKNAYAGTFVDAAEIFPAMADAIASARSEVVLETFEWDPAAFSFDEAWQTDPTMVLVDGVRRLEKRMKSGPVPAHPVRVYVTLDGRHRNAPEKVGPLAVNKARNLRRQLASFGGFDARYVDLHVGVHERFGAGGMHSKLLVVDGYRAILTGANAQRFQTLGSSWHDSGYEIVGEAGVAMARNFDDTWKESSEVTSCDLGDPTTDAKCVVVGSRSIPHEAGALHPALDLVPELDGACMPVFAANKRAIGLSYPASLSVADTGNPQDAAFLAMLQKASKAVKVESPNMNARGADEAFAAAKRGAAVHVVLSFGFNAAAERMSFGPINGGGSNEDTVRALYARMKKEPTACGKLEVRWVSKDGVRATPQSEAGSSHVKFMTVDGQVGMVGSANQDVTSWFLTRETNVMVDDATAVAEMNARVFDLDWSRGAPVQAWAAHQLDRTEADLAADGTLQYFLGDARAWACDVVTACGGSHPKCN
jgi:phosphatidylserine/phosphatidylglycerophosphate/cardiolipin synthase-like enzyme